MVITLRMMCQVTAEIEKTRTGSFVEEEEDRSPHVRIRMYTCIHVRTCMLCLSMYIRTCMCIIMYMYMYMLCIRTIDQEIFMLKLNFHVIIFSLKYFRTLAGHTKI